MSARILPLLLLAPTLSHAQPQPVDHDGLRVELRTWGPAEWTVVVVDLERLRIDLVGQAPGDPRRFEDLPGDVLAAMNAGIYETVDEPTGWFVEGGRERHAINRAAGRGNFFLQPNGAFWIDAVGPAVAPTAGIAPIGPVSAATQSGPLLRWRGVDAAGIDPRWTGRTSRNAIAVLDDTHVALVYTRGQVTLGELRGFVGDLGADDALYLDGTVSDLCVAPACGRPSRSWAGMIVVRE